MDISPKIDLFVIGAQKAGTTSLKNYLGEHPDILTHESKEFSFFYDDEEYGKGYNTAFKKYFGRSDSGGRKVVCKHAHLYSSEKAIQRLREHNPDCQLVLILRNPVSRTFSSYLMEKLYSRVNFEFEEMKHALDGSGKLKLEDWQFEALIQFGLYASYIEIIYKYFPKEQVRLILFEDFKKTPLKYCRQIFSGFKVNSEFQPRVRVVHNKTAIPRSQMLAAFIKVFLVEKNPVKEGIKRVMPANATSRLGERLRDVNRSEKANFKMSAEMTEFLQRYFEPHNQQLSRLTGLNLSSWKE